MFWSRFARRMTVCISDADASSMQDRTALRPPDSNKRQIETGHVKRTCRPNHAALPLCPVYFLEDNGGAKRRSCPTKLECRGRRQPSRPTSPGQSCGSNSRFKAQKPWTRISPSKVLKSLYGLPRASFAVNNRPRIYIQAPTHSSRNRVQRFLFWWRCGESNSGPR